MTKPLSQHTDEELVAEIRGDNDAAYALLLNRYKDPLVNITTRCTGDLRMGVDVAVDTFVMLYVERHRLTLKGSFSAWLYGAALRTSRRVLRRKKLRQMIRLTHAREEEIPEFDLPRESPDSSAAATAPPTEDRLLEAIDALPLALREVIVLRDIQDLGEEDIAAILRHSPDRVRPLIARGRMMLEEELHAPRSS